MNFLDKWNKAKFNAYESEEKTVLKLLTNLSNFIGELTGEVDKKTDLNGDHKGSWQGIDRPTLSEEGMRGTVEKNQSDIEYLKETVNDSYIKYSKYKSFDKIFEKFTSGTINIDEDITLSNSLILPKDFNLISFNNSKITSGHFDGIVINSIVTLTRNVSSVIKEESAIIVDNKLGLNPNDLVIIYSDQAQNLITTIKSVDVTTNKIILNEMPYNTFFTNPKLSKLEKNNNEIKGITFIKNVPTDKKDILINGNYIDILDNKFINGVGMTITGASNVKVKNNVLDNVGDCLLVWDCCNVKIERNTITRFEQGIRCIYPYRIEVLNNDIYWSKNKQYSIGIELSGTGYIPIEEKICYNKVIGNRVHEANEGVPGSANGGIHLNFYAHHNLIQNNVVTKNGIGIYLENYCENNIIDNNISSYNRGYYGVGIECDWNCHNNTITNNTCEYNNGSIESFESCGIQIRSGKSSGEHMIYNSIVANNKCRYNGQTGIYLSGFNSICTGNICEFNGTNNGFEHACDLMIIDAKNSVVSNNAINGNSQKYNVVINESEKVLFNYNSINAMNGTETTTLLVKDSSVIKIEHNLINTVSRERRIYITGKESVRAYEIRFNENIIDGADNGFPQVEFIHVTTFSVKNNLLMGNTTVTKSYVDNEII